MKTIIATYYSKYDELTSITQDINDHADKILKDNKIDATCEVIRTGNIIFLILKNTILNDEEIQVIEKEASCKFNKKLNKTNGEFYDYIFKFRKIRFSKINQSWLKD